MSEQVKKLTVPVEVPEGAHELNMALASVAISLHSALIDGLGIEDIGDLADIIKDTMDAVSAFMPAIDDARADKFGTALSADAIHGHPVNGESDSFGAHDHSITGGNSGADGDHDHSITSGESEAGGSHDHSISGDSSATGNAETRPTNMSVVWIMRVK